MFGKTIHAVLLLWISILALSGCGGGGTSSKPTSGGPSASLPLTISSFQSTSSGQPFSLLTINGQGFNPNAQLDVTFFNESGFSVTVPAVLANATAVAVSIPSFFDPGGNLAAGAANLKLRQTSSSGATVTSNVLTGLQIQAPPVTPLPAGTLVLAFLEATLGTDTNLRSSIAGTPLDTPVMQSAVSTQIATLQNLIPQVQSVATGASTSYTIGQLTGVNVAVGSRDLANADKLFLGLLTAFAGPEPDLTSFGSSSVAGRAPFRGVAVSSRVAYAATPNPIQLAAQAVLTAATNPLTTAAQFNAAVAAFIASFVQANPDLTVHSLIGMLGLLGTITAVEVGSGPVLPTLLLAGFLQFGEGIAALGAAVDVAAVLSGIGGIGTAIVEVCSKGLSASTFISGFVGGVSCTRPVDW